VYLLVLMVLAAMQGGAAEKASVAVVETEEQ
jgi:hypothetical protein